jgi:hypothetical protein
MFLPQPAEPPLAKGAGKGVKGAVNKRRNAGRIVPALRNGDRTCCALDRPRKPVQSRQPIDQGLILSRPPPIPAIAGVAWRWLSVGGV